MSTAKELANEIARRWAVNTIKKLRMFDPKNHLKATTRARDLVEEIILSDGVLEQLVQERTTIKEQLQL